MAYDTDTQTVPVMQTNQPRYDELIPRKSTGRLKEIQ